MKTLIIILVIGFILFGVFLYSIFMVSKDYIQRTRENVLDHSYDGTIKDGTKNILIGEVIILAHGQNKEKKSQIKRIVNRGSVVYDDIYNPQEIIEGKYLGE